MQIYFTITEDVRLMEIIQPVFLQLPSSLLNKCNEEKYSMNVNYFSLLEKKKNDLT